MIFACWGRSHMLGHLVVVYMEGSACLLWWGCCFIFVKYWIWYFGIYICIM